MFFKMFYQSLRDLCATPGANIKRKFGIVLSTLSPSTKKSHLVIVNEFGSEYIRQSSSNITIAFGHTINELSCAAWRRLCQKVNLPICQARRPLCHKVNLPSKIATYMPINPVNSLSQTISCRRHSSNL